MNNLRSCDELVEAYKKSERGVNPCRLKFIGCEGYDVYNPSIPFIYKKKTLMVGRVEKRDSEESKAIFFEKVDDNTFCLAEGMKQYELQDPFIVRIQSKWVLGGVETFPHPENPENLWWRTKFYYGDDLENLEVLGYGPNGMKDIRLVEVDKGKVGVFTRPQGEIGGRGKIGFILLDRIEELKAARLMSAKLLHQFHDEEWGGVNQALPLPKGQIGVIGHIASFTEGEVRHYYAMAFKLNPIDMTYTPIKIIAIRDDFLSGEAKRDDLVDVLFSAGIVIDNNVTRLYAGVSDCEVQTIEIPYPF